MWCNDEGDHVSKRIVEMDHDIAFTNNVQEPSQQIADTRLAQSLDIDNSFLSMLTTSHSSSKKSVNEQCSDKPVDYPRFQTRNTKVHKPPMRIVQKTSVDYGNIKEDDDIDDILHFVDEILSKQNFESKASEITESFESGNDLSDTSMGLANPNFIKRDTPESKLGQFDQISISEPLSRRNKTLGDLASNDGNRLSAHDFQLPVTSNDLSSHTSHTFGFYAKKLRSECDTIRRRNMKPPARVPIGLSEIDDDDGDGDDDIIGTTASNLNENNNIKSSFNASLFSNEPSRMEEENKSNGKLPTDDLGKFLLSPETRRLFKTDGWQSVMSFSRRGENLQMESSEKTTNSRCADKSYNLKSSCDIPLNVDQNINSTARHSFKTKTSLLPSQTRCVRPPLRVPIDSVPKDLDLDDDDDDDIISNDVRPVPTQTFLDLLKDAQPAISSSTGTYSKAAARDSPFDNFFEHKNRPLDSEFFFLSNDPPKRDHLDKNDRKPEARSQSSSFRKSLSQSSVIPPNAIRIGHRIFIKHELLGKGGFSKVYRGSSSDVIDCAIKCVDLSDADEATVASYVGEVSIMEQLQGSAGIIKLYDHHLDNDNRKLYLVMERGEMDLKSFFVNHSKANPVGLPSLVRFCWSQMLRAVKSLHDNGIVHWDLKPANFVVVRGALKVIDFGISKKVLPDHTSVTSDQIMGTYNYMSPEAFNNLSNDPEGEEIKIKVGTKSDIWSLGCILYSMVYGAAPFQKINDPMQKILAITSKEIHFPSTHLGHQVVETLKKCLTRETKKRPSVNDLLEDPFLIK